MVLVKKVRTSIEKSPIQIPRDRNGSFSVTFVLKHGWGDGIENVIVALYLKGMSNSDVEEQISGLSNFELSTSTISRITEKDLQNSI